MAKTKVSEWSSTASSNTDIDSINIAEGCAPSGINDAIRELMSQVKDFQAGTYGDSFNGPVGTSTAAAGAFTTLSASGAVTLSGGTANGVAYLNGSKVLTTGSALTFDGTNTFKIASSSGYLRSENLAGTVAAYVAQDGLYSFGTNLITYAPSGYSHLFYVNASEQMRLTSTGLGIGTSSITPAGYGLHIKGSANQVAIKLENPQARTFQILSNGSTGGGGAANGNFTIYDDTAGADRLILSAAGNLGLGVTPPTGSGNYRALNVGAALMYGNTGLAIASYTSNADINDKYIISGYASSFQQYQGAFKWYTAPSGTAGNAISFTQAMTLSAAGNLGIGNTAPLAELVVGAAQTLPDTGAVAQFSGSVEVCNSIANSYRAQLETDSSTFYIGSNTYYSGGWQVYDSARAPAQIQMASNNASSHIAFFTSTSNSGNGSERARIDSSGNFTLWGAGYTRLEGTYGRTSGSAANVYIYSDGQLYRSTSSIKYKQNVQDATHGLSELMSLRSVTYQGKGESDGDTVFGGLIAEEVHAAGLTEFVQYAEDGSPDALAYGNMVSLCIKAIQEQQAIIDSLKARLDAANL
jgi:hypothetical protein